MKSRTKKRILALVLCMVVALSNSSFIFASETGDVEYPTEAYTAEAEVQPQAIAETGENEAVPQGGEEQPVTSEPTAEPTVEPTTEPTPEVTPEATPQATPEITPEPTPEVTPQVTADDETPTVEATAVQPEEEPVVVEPTEEPDENELTVLEYEDGEVKIRLEEKVQGAIPEGASLKVVPIVKQEVTAAMSAEEQQEVAAINEQYDEVESKLNEKAENETYDIAGFLVYDISLVDTEGNKMEPNSDVKVTMEYKKASLPESLETEDTSEMDVTIMHLEEDQNGNVTRVVDMAQDENKVENIETTSAQEIKQAIFETNSFSAYAITWQGNTIKSVDDKTITEATYKNYLNSMLQEVEGTANGNLPIKDWKRSAQKYRASIELTDTAKESSESTKNQKWWNTVSEVDTNHTEQDAVWDGSRRSTHYYQGYLKNNRVTIYDGKLYDSATWTEHYNLNGNLTDSSIYRFKGTFDIGDVNPNEYTFTIQQVTGNDRLYINDDMWVFVYPEGTNLTSENYMDYLAFWTGTRNQNNSLKYFNDRRGTVATKEGTTPLHELTDQWSMESVKDNAGAIIQSVYNKGNHATKYVIDVIADDYNTGGGMYRLTMKKEASEKVPVQLKKVTTSGTPLAGAVFALEDDSHSVYYTAVSGTDGMVSFNVLPGKTYTLRETKAPTGYVRNTTTWTVTVNADGSYTISNLEKGHDGIYKVTNNSEREEALKGLESSKTVEVTNYDKREYKITLSASTTGQTAGEEAVGASVILVLDASASMKENNKKLQDIQDAAIGFVDELKKVSDKSEVDVIWYSGSENDDNNVTITSSGFKTINTQYESIKSTINNKLADGGTPMGKALAQANNDLKNAKYSNKYVLLFTDGMPGYWPDNVALNCMVANNANNNAAEIKKSAVLYTVGYQLGDSEFEWKPGHSGTSGDSHGDHDTTTTAKNFLKDYIATTGDGTKTYAYTVDDKDELSKEFKSLAGSIGALYSIQPTKIVDVIDARFQLTDAQKKQFDENENISYTENEDGTTTITWTGDAAHIGNKNSTDTTNKPWSATIDIVAKDDFIGGNAIPTNTGDSGIYITDTDIRYFAKPTVNVKPLSLTMTGKEITVYKGDSLQPLGFYQELAETLKVKMLKEVDGTDETMTGVVPVLDGKVVLPALTEEQKTQLAESKTLTIGTDEVYKYKYPNTTDAVGYFTYTYQISETPGGNITDHLAGEPATPAEKYTLVVDFVPYTVTERVTTNGTIAPAANGGTAVTNKLTASADYVVNIIAGEIQITKILDGEPLEGSSTFTFKVTGPNNFEKEISLTVEKDATTGIYTASYAGADLKNLARGEYTVSEIETEGYQIKDTPAIGSETNTWHTIDTVNDQVTFKLGYENQSDVIDVIKNQTYQTKDGGVLGQVTYTNEIAYDWAIIKVSKSSQEVKLEGAEFTLSNSTTTYYGKSNASGEVEWFTDAAFTEAVDKLDAGTYTLKETKAPAGYSLANVEYTVEITRNGLLKNVKQGNSEIELTIADGKHIVYIENEVLYDLPSTGSTGIFTTMMGGILLMMAGILIIFKMRREGVLKR